MTNTLNVHDQHMTSTVNGRCPAHGDWNRKFPHVLNRQQANEVECPQCDNLPSLKALHIDTVEIRGTCQKHGDWAQQVVKFAAPHMRDRCPDCEKARQAAQDAEERRQHVAHAHNKRESKIAELVDRAGVPRRFQLRRFDNYLVECEGQDEALTRARRYAHKFDVALTRGASMIFHGFPGTGKTHLAAAIANHVIPAFGASVLFITVYELMQRVRATYKSGGDGEAKLLRELGELDLLILDEVGVQLGTKHEEVILTDIINRRYADVRPTLLLSNLDREGLEKQLGSRIIDRMQEGGGGILAFEWASYRDRVQADQRLENPKYTPPDWLAVPGSDEGA